MRNFLLFLVCLFACSSSFGQTTTIGYAHDASGNRVSRTPIIIRTATESGRTGNDSLSVPSALSVSSDTSAIQNDWTDSIPEIARQYRMSGYYKNLPLVLSERERAIMKEVLVQLRDSREKAWRAAAITERKNLGQPTEITTGTVSRQYGFSAYGLPTYRKMAAGTLQDVSYSFDPTKNLLNERQDDRNGTDEEFFYETNGLQRLVRTEFCTSSGDRMQSIAYTSNGNPAYKSDAGFLYYDNTARPYQVTSLFPASDTLVLARAQAASYTCFDRPAVLSEGGRSATFTYDGDCDRVRMAVVDSTGAGPVNVLTRYYLGGRYEIDQTPSGCKERLDLGGTAYSAPMVLQRVNGGSWTLYNIGRDCQGSITQVATAGGTLVAEYSYDPWGRLLDPATLKPYAAGSEPELFLGRGYTAHEHLSWFGLINMNARLYDPLLGRFLSPDPFVQAPDFTQNFNRYSYALGNPMKYTDESGEWIHIVIGAAIGGIGGLIANWNNCDGFWQYAAAFGVGALAGAAVAATGGAVAAAGGTFWGTVGLISVGALGGAANSATGDIIAQTGKGFSGLNNIDRNSVGRSAIIGGVAGAVGTGVGAALSNVNIPIKINGTELRSPILSSFLIGGASSSAGGVAAGTTLGLLEGERLGVAFKRSLGSFWSSALIGGAVSASTTAAYGLIYGINPLDGSPITTKGNMVTADDLGIKNEVERIKSGRRYTFKHDGTKYYNKTSELPLGADYTEFIVPPSSGLGAGTNRIYRGSNNKWYYSPDHHHTFIEFKP